MDTETKEVVIEASFKDFETLLTRAQSFYEVLNDQPELMQSLGSVRSIFENVDQRIQITIRPAPKSQGTPFTNLLNNIITTTSDPSSWMTITNFDPDKFKKQFGEMKDE